MTKYGVNTAPKRVCKTHGEAYNVDESCKWCTPSSFVESLKRVVDDYQPETCPHVGTYACGCIQCLIYQQGLYP